jgi:Ser/Thr protein kinase RdoA (MazF antagonist)
MSQTNPLNESQLAVVRAEVVDTARSLSSRELPFLEGVRRLTALRFEVSRDHHDADFMLFVAIGSQADHIPNAEARALCAESWLLQCDKDVRELEHFYAQQVSAACKQLIARFSPEA